MFALFEVEEKDKKYIYKTPEEIKQYIDDIDKDSLQIIGTFDRSNPKGIDVLEL